MNVISLVLCCISFFLFGTKKRRLLQLVIATNSIPVAALVFIAAHEYPRASLVSFGISVLWCITSLLVRRVQHTPVDSHIRTGVGLMAPFSVFLFLLFGVTAFGIAISPEYSYLQFHLGVVAMPTLLYLISRFGILFAVISLVNCRQSMTSTVIALFSFGMLPQFFYFFLGFRFPFISWFLSGFAYLTYARPGMMRRLRLNSAKKVVIFGIVITAFMFAVQATSFNRRGISGQWMDHNPFRFIAIDLMVGAMGSIEIAELALSEPRSPDSEVTTEFSPLCMALPPHNFSEFLPRSIYTRIVSSLTSGGCETFSIRANRDTDLPAGAGLGSSIVADLYSMFGFFAIFIIIIGMSLLVLFDRYAIRFPYSPITVVGFMFIVPVLFPLFRLGIYSIVLIDLVVAFVAAITSYSFIDAARKNAYMSVLTAKTPKPTGDSL